MSLEQPEAASKPPKWLHWIEDQAALLRASVSAAPEDRIDPRAVAHNLGLKIVDLKEIHGARLDDLVLLSQLNATKWSGSVIPLPNGKFIVILNPQQTPERANVTIMEEVAHVHYGHEPSQLIPKSDGSVGRIYNKESEDEAYWTAAAALLPSIVIARAVWQNVSAETLAASYGASTDLVKFRIKTLGFWSDYVSYAA